MNISDNFLKGKKILIYDPAEYSVRDIITLLIKTENILKKKLPEQDIIRTYIFNKNFSGSSIFIDENSFLPGHREAVIAMGCENRFEFNNTHQFVDHRVKTPLLKRKINKVSLLFPVISSDKRVDSINLTSSALFLGSMLRENNFKIKTGKIDLKNPNHMILPYWDSDLLGFTLFEDFFVEFSSFLKTLPANRLIAAGGPFITLNPLKSVFHLPEINLFVRGEAEFALPEILNHLNGNDIEHLLSVTGFLFHLPGILIISDFNEINFPTDFSSFNFNMDFIEPSHLKNGLEVNFSRGCKRNCIFCSRVQGKTLRKLDIDKIGDLLIKVKTKLSHSFQQFRQFMILNINDDDILQDKEYAKTVFKTINKENFSVWGIQSSIASFFKKNLEVDNDIIKFIAEEINFVKERLIWIGTDTFTVERAKRLGKIFPPEDKFIEVINAFEKSNIFNYHYWISSDYLTNWDEFLKELFFIIELSQRFKFFRLLPHAPFLIPYPSTAAYRYISRDGFLSDRIVYKKKYKTGYPELDLNIAKRVETGYPSLNELLKNSKPSGREGFFDYLKNSDFVNAMINAYIFVKEERLRLENFSSDMELKKILRSEKNLFEKISQFH